MKYALYDKVTGKIISIVQSTERPMEFNQHLGYVEAPDDVDSLTFEVANGVVVKKGDDEIKRYETERAWVTLRRIRSSLLSSCDWTQVPDAPVDHAAWAAYRQALRDLPATTTDPTSPVWPTPPA